MSKELTVLVSEWAGGRCLYLNDYRIAGEKPWGGGRTHMQWRTTEEDVLRALGLDDLRAQLAEAEAKLADVNEAVDRERLTAAGLLSDTQAKLQASDGLVVEMQRLLERALNRRRQFDSQEDALRESSNWDDTATELLSSDAAQAAAKRVEERIEAAQREERIQERGNAASCVAAVLNFIFNGPMVRAILADVLANHAGHDADCASNYEYCPGCGHVHCGGPVFPCGDPRGGVLPPCNCLGTARKRRPCNCPFGPLLEKARALGVEC